MLSKTNRIAGLFSILVVTLLLTSSLLKIDKPRLQGNAPAGWLPSATVLQADGVAPPPIPPPPRG